MTPASLRRLLAVWRAFGLSVACNVVVSKIRGKLNPTAALSESPVYASRRLLSFLMRVEEHDAATLRAVAEAVRASGGALEAVFCMPSSILASDASSLVMRLRGACAWLRFVTAKDGVDEATVASWTVEQATGQYVVFVAKSFVLTAFDVSCLLARLEDDEDPLAVGLFAMDASGRPLGAVHLLALRKSFYLARFPASFPMTASALFEALVLGGTSAIRIPCAR